MFISVKQYQKERKEKKDKKIKITPIGLGLHSIANICCTDYNGNTVYQNTYLVTTYTIEKMTDEIIQAILDDIKAIKGKFPVKINTITMYTEDDYGERHVFFDMDDCESILFNE